MRSIVHVREHLPPGAIADNVPPETVPEGNEAALENYFRLDRKNDIAGDAGNPRYFDGSEDQNSEYDLNPLFDLPSEFDVLSAERILGKSGDAKYRKAVEARGLDALAWYMSFHYRGPQWGIYIPLSSLVWIAAFPLRELKCDLRTGMSIAFRLLWQHELFHFATDYMVAQWELAQKRAIYIPAKARLRTSPGGCDVLEEQLANAQAIRTVRRMPRKVDLKGKTAALKKFFRGQPSGYRDFENSLKTEKFQEDCERLARAYCCSSDPSLSDALELRQLFPFADRNYPRNCPVFIFHDEHKLGLPTLGIELFPHVAAVVESEAFRRELAKLDGVVGRMWEGTKRKLLTNPSLPGLDLKKWGGRFSVRLNDNFRAHLEYKAPNLIAVAVGNHKAMGHG